jgi:hypothetical protein
VADLMSPSTRKKEDPEGFIAHLASWFTKPTTSSTTDLSADAVQKAKEARKKALEDANEASNGVKK